jgi:fucose permease
MLMLVYVVVVAFRYVLAETAFWKWTISVEQNDRQ